MMGLLSAMYVPVRVHIHFIAKKCVLYDENYRIYAV